MLNFRVLVLSICATFCALLLAIGGAQAQSASDEKWREFRDWAGTCHEDGSCVARTLSGAGSGENGEEFRLQVNREGGEFTSFVVSFIAVDNPPAEGEILNVRVIGGTAFAMAQGAGYGTGNNKNRFYFTDQSMLDALVPAMLRGNQMSVSFRDKRGENYTANISMLGLGAALSWMNKKQFRGHNTVDAGPPLNLASAKKDEGDAANIPPLQLPSGLVALHSQVEACEGWAGRPALQNGSQRFELGEDIKLFIVPCTPGTNNPASRVYVEYKGGALDAILFARFNEATGWTGTDKLANADFDNEQKILVSQFKEQGLEGCGVLGLWQWQDGGFAMKRYAVWRDCEVARPVNEWQVIYLRPEE